MDGDKADFLACGLDSAQTIELASGLRALLRPQLNPTDLSTIAAKALCANSTVDSLAESISGLLGMKTDIGGDGAAKRVARMSAMLDKYTRDLPEVRSGAMQTDGAAHTNGSSHTHGISRANSVAHTRYQPCTVHCLDGLHRLARNPDTASTIKGPSGLKCVLLEPCGRCSAAGTERHSFKVL